MASCINMALLQMRNVTPQLKANDVLKSLLEALDRSGAQGMKAAAQEHIDDFTEEFFLISSTFMEMARLMPCLALLLASSAAE